MGKKGNAGSNQPASSAPSRSTSNNSNNSSSGSVGQAVRAAGGNRGVVNYVEASQIASRFGLTVDQVYAKAQDKGLIAKAGGAAAAAGYTPTPGVVVSRQFVQNQQPGTQFTPPAGTDFAAGPALEFDWEAWNAEMMSRQQAMWDTMDAMNSAFIQKQQDWYKNNNKLPGSPESRSSVIGSGIPSDRATVRRAKRTRKASDTAIGNDSISLGGQGKNSNGLSIGNTPARNLGS